MSVTLRNGGRAFAGEGDRPAPDRKPAPDRRVPFERFESAFHAALALTLVAGLAIMLVRGAQAPQADDASQRGVIVAKPKEIAPEPPAPEDALFDIAAIVRNPQVMAAFSAMPENAPEPLAPPASQLREKLQGRRPPPARAADGPSRALAYAEPEAEAEAPMPATETNPAEEAATSKCYAKLSGRVAAKGPCRIRNEGERIAFELPGKTLALAHERGRIWTATLDGRVLGKAYRRGSCWVAPRLYVCDRG